MPGSPCGSPSSRLPRSPMWPLDSANTDSLWASSSRLQLGLADRPRLDRETTGGRSRLRPAARRGRRRRRRRRAARSASRLADAVDADDVAEVPGAAGLDAGERVLEHRRVRGLDAERARAGEERVGRGLAREVLARRRRRRRRAPRTGRRCRPRRARRGSWCSTRRPRAAARRRARPRRSAPSPRRPRRRRSWISSSTSSFLRLPSPSTVSASGGSSGVPSGSSMPRDCEERAHAVVRAACRRRTRRSRRRRRTRETPRRAPARACAGTRRTSASTPRRGPSRSGSARRRGRSRQASISGGVRARAGKLQTRAVARRESQRRGLRVASVTLTVDPFHSLYSHGFARVAAAVPARADRRPRVQRRSARWSSPRAPRTQNAALVVFPELGLSGYAIDDLLHQQSLTRRGARRRSRRSSPAAPRWRR